MTEFIIHVGPQKTGTKYIQSHLYNLRHKLLDEGVYYPSEFWTGPDQIFHNNFLMELRNTDGFRLQKLIDDIRGRGYKQVVLSTEGLSELPIEKIEVLKQVIGQSDVRFVYYLRKWSDRIPSDWQQDVRSGHFDEFSAFYLGLIQNPLRKIRINYSMALDKLSGLFGRESLILISYSNIKKSKMDLFAHFASSVLNWKKPYSAEGPIQPNLSPTTEVSEITRCLNFLEFDRLGEKSRNMPIRLFELRDHVRPQVEELTELVRKDFTTIDINDSAPQFDRLYDLLMRYSDRVVNLDPKVGIFERSSKSHNTVGANFLMRDGVVQRLAKLHNDLIPQAARHPELAL